MRPTIISSLVTLLLGCTGNDNPPMRVINFGTPTSVTLSGYSEDIMEPFLSRNGQLLFFNNSNDPAVNTDLHWATKVDDSTFTYQGLIEGINTTALDGVASMDQNNHLFFVSLREYEQTLKSIFSTNYANGTVTEVQALDNLSLNIPGWVNFDVEVDVTGEWLYFVDGRFDEAGGPYEADLALAKKSGSSFERVANSASILQHINSSDLEYAASISDDQLELFFTRVAAPITSTSVPEIFVSRRSDPSEEFGIPQKIASITGFAEAPSVSSDGKVLYYHGLGANGKIKLFMVRREN